MRIDIYILCSFVIANMELYKHDRIYYGYSDCRARKFNDEKHEVFIVDNTMNGLVDFVFCSQNLCDRLNLKGKDRYEKHDECQQLIRTVRDKLKDNNFDINYIHEGDATTIYVGAGSEKKADKVLEFMKKIMNEL